MSPYAVLADQTGAVGADTAEGAQILAILFQFVSILISIQDSLEVSFSVLTESFIGEFREGKHTIRGNPCRTCRAKRIMVSLVALCRDCAFCVG